ncbi:MAG TPA: hypothetical protein PLD20_34905 [Blastocatellia bacterium]|nr:hypothetical protein [Blastocatellia bacterium]HMZ23166.1 hypothetical protein [Blastocatellia bacterium]
MTIASGAVERQLRRFCTAYRARVVDGSALLVGAVAAELPEAGSVPQRLKTPSGNKHKKRRRFHNN